MRTADPRALLFGRWREALALVLALAALGSAAVSFWPRPVQPLVVATPTTRPTASPLPRVAVHVVGAVGRPGLYDLPAGARISDAITLAGGFSDEADPSSVNLAARVVDGQQLAVRAKASALGSPVAAQAQIDGKLDLNQASLAELDTLPGVGPVLAQRILDRRQRLGPFASVEQLRDERLLPGPTYERVKDLVVVR